MIEKLAPHIPRPPRLRPLAGHAVAVAATLVVFAVQHSLLPTIELVPFILFFLSVFLAAWIGGRGPGFTAIVLSAALANYHFLPPANDWSLAPRELFLTGLFALVSTVVNLVSGSLRDKIEEGERREALLRAVLDQMPAGVLVADHSGELIATNQEIARLFPLQEPPTRIGERRGFHPDGRPYTRPEWPLERSLRGEVVIGEEIEIERGDGTHAHLSVNSAPVRDGRGRIVAAVAVDLDITARKHAEEALRQADRNKDEFLALLAHELRNPLAPIANAVQILERSGGNAALEERARIIIGRQVQHMVRLIDDLLDVSRITRGKIGLKRERIELAHVVENAIETSRPSIEASEHALEVDLPPDPVVLDADPTRLGQVFANLLNNAAKFTPRGGRVTVRANVEGGRAVVRVADTGVGIPAEKLHRVFDLFFQGDRSVERASGGLGVGLALSKRLVDLHGGSIEVHSPGPAGGSEFTVWLPVVANREPVSPSSAVPAEPNRPTPLRVLVVDDNADAAESIGILLGTMGHEVRVAHDGANALDLAPGYRPDVVILDIGMPGMDGYEVARRLRQRPEVGGAFLVAVTGFGQEEDRRRAMEAGFDRHLTKPTDVQELKGILSLRQGSARGEPTTR